MDYKRRHRYAVLRMVVVYRIVKAYAFPWKLLLFRKKHAAGKIQPKKFGTKHDEGVRLYEKKLAINTE